MKNLAFDEAKDSEGLVNCDGCEMVVVEWLIIHLPRQNIFLCFDCLEKVNKVAKAKKAFQTVLSPEEQEIFEKMVKNKFSYTSVKLKENKGIET